MASGSSGRTGLGGLKGFDFGSDDILCSYDDIDTQEVPSGNHRDPVVSSSSGKDFREGKMGRPSSYTYNHQEESLNQDLVSTVEKTVKKYADNLLRFLEGISSRLSQLESCCYNLEKSVGEMRSDLVQEHTEADSKLRSLEKHLQEVHRSVQILRDKQELADTQKELAKLQLVQKESSSVSHSQHKEEGGAQSASDSQKVDNAPEGQNLQLALALPHQVAASASLPPRPVEQQQALAVPNQALPQNVHTQVQPTYYPQQNQLPNPIPQTQRQPQDQYLQADPHYQRPQMQDLSKQVPQPTPPPPPPAQPQVSQAQQMHSFLPYQQQWPQQFPQQVQPPPAQQPLQPQVRPQTTPAYSSYPPTQPANPSPPETFSGSMPMQVPFSGMTSSSVGHAEPMAYGYGGVIRPTVQPSLAPQLNMQRQQPPPTNQSTFGMHLNDGSFAGTGPHPPQQGYMMYDGESGRTHQLPSHYPQGSYPPPAHASLQNPKPTSGGNLMVRHPSPSQMMRSHMYSEMIEKAVSMGYMRDHVASVINRLEESGQPVDFNSVLDRLNGHSSSGGSQRGWSG